MAKRNHQISVPIAKADFDWKNHPVIIASGSAVAAFLLSLAVFTQLVAPTQTAKLEIELIKLKDAKEKIDRNYVSSIRTNKKLVLEKQQVIAELKEHKSKSAALLQELIDFKAGNILSPDNPYPNGLGLVRIGMFSSEIKKNYPNQTIEIDEDDANIVTVGVANSPFDKVTYYLKGAGKTATIAHIAFDMPYFDSKYSKDFVYKELVENYGEPSKDSTSKAFMWKVGNSYSIFAYEKNGYVLMSRGDQPIFWAVR